MMSLRKRMMGQKMVKINKKELMPANNAKLTKKTGKTYWLVPSALSRRKHWYICERTNATSTSFKSPWVKTMDKV